MPFSIERNDVATMPVDAVVVAANEKLKITGGVGASVAKAAGFEQMQDACAALAPCPTGQAVVTDGLALPARFVVHAVGPVWVDGGEEEKALLRSAYDNALTCACDAGAYSIALPLISAGTYGCPVEISFALAMQAVRSFLETHDADVRVVLYDRRAVAAGMALYGELAEYIDDHYVAAHHAESNRERAERLAMSQRPPRDYTSYASGGMAAAAAPEPTYAAKPPQHEERSPRGVIGRVGEAVRDRLARMHYEERARKEEEREKEKAALELQEASFEYDVLEDAEYDTCFSDAPMWYAPTAQTTDLASMLEHLDAPFSTTLLALIDARGLEDAQVYKRANMSRQLFSKIRSDAAYRPKKNTVLALAVALELDLDETSDLLKRAGYALSSSSKSDVIVEYFIGRGDYDIFAINEALYAFDQPLL